MDYQIAWIRLRKLAVDENDATLMATMLAIENESEPQIKKLEGKHDE